MSIRCEVSGDSVTLVAAVSGRLRLEHTVPLRDQLYKCLAEQPDALLVDLSGLHVDQPLALSILPVVLRQAARWPGTPVLLCAPPPGTRRHLGIGANQRMPLFDSRDAALAHLHDGRRTMPSVSEELLPVSGSARHARDIATEACLRWDLPDLIAPASLVANELVANVVDHAHTMMTLRLSVRDRYLNIAVRDGSPEPPVARTPAPAEVLGGRGLLLVSELAHSWGHLPSKDGKVVWAAIRRT
ncbi:ATP-binding protein [Actinoplanes sp. G11-F43]|uniref:ATP-binding protein n=1 Tax=Actinoplanes sp. G11-F43 TaxID=3424130 RepID=UPI003D352B08